MAYLAALIAGAAAFWLALSPDPLSSGWLTAGAVVVAVTLVLAWRMGLIDREAAPYLRAPAFAIFFLSQLAGALRATGSFLRAALSFDLSLSPALVRLKTRRGDDLARVTFANGVALAPGLLTVDCDEDSVLIHALVEDDADEGDLRSIEKRAWAAVGGAREQSAPEAPA